MAISAVSSVSTYVPTSQARASASVTRKNDGDADDGSTQSAAKTGVSVTRKNDGDADDGSTQAAARPARKAPPAGGKPLEVAAASKASSTSSSAKIYDKRDANQDGVVSDEEQVAYDLKQAALSQESKASSSYTQQGKPASTASGAAQSTFNLFA